MYPRGSHDLRMAQQATVPSDSSSIWRVLASQSAPPLALLAIFICLNRLWLSPWVLEEQHYRATVIFWGAIQALTELSPRTLATVSVCALLLFGARRLLSLTWAQFDETNSARLLVCASGSVLAWMYSTYEFNFVFDQWHVYDRILLVVLAVAMWWRPAACFPFLFVLWPLIGQFEVPIGGYSWAVPFLPARIVLLMGSAMLWGLLCRGRWDASTFWFVVLCLISAHYFTPGWSKLRKGWFAEDQLYYLLANTHANGWLGFLSDSKIHDLTDQLASWNMPLKVFTLVAEVSSLFILCRRAMTFLLPWTWVLFHIGIFVVSGICFWPWVVVHAAFLWSCWRGDPIHPSHRRRPMIILSIGLIGLSPIWANAVRLTWIDSPVTYAYQFMAVDKNGQEQRVSPAALSPYEYQFTLGGLHYLTDEPTLNITWGATSRETFQRLREAGSAKEIIDVEQSFGQRFGDRQRSDNLCALIQRAFRDEAREKQARLGYLRAPAIVWTNWDMTRCDAQLVRVERVLKGFVRKEYGEISRLEIAEIPLIAADDVTRP